MKLAAVIASFAFSVCLVANAAAQQPPAYGTPINLAAAKRIVAAAEAEAQRNDWPVAIAIVDSGGHLVLFHRLDNTQYGSVEIAIGKAKTSALYRRPTKAFEERLAEGGANVKLIQLPSLIFEGGLPILHEGKVIGGIGVSGVQSDQDAQVGQAGLKALEESDGPGVRNGAVTDPHPR